MKKSQSGKIFLKIGILGIIILIFILGIKLYRDKTHSIKKIKTTFVEYRRMDVGVFSTGIIEPIKKVKIIAEISGIIEDIRCQIGDNIEKNTILGIINSPEIIQNLQNIENIKIKLKQADIDCENALQKYMRFKKLYNEMAVSKEMVEEAEAEYNKFCLTTQLLKQQLEIEKKKYNQLQRQTKITPPISGIILDQNVESGMLVSPGTILFTVAKLNELVVKCNIPEVDVGKISKGMSAKITMETLPQQEFWGDIIKISPFPIADKNIPLFEVIILIKNPLQKLQIGRSVNVEMFSTTQAKKLTIPIEAINIKDGKKFVFVVQDGILWEREITVGAVDIENKYIEIISGLKEKEEICISLDEGLKEGMQVEVIGGKNG